MWLYLCMQELGTEKANKINKEAVKSMAGIEIHRILKLMGRGKDPITAFNDLKEIIDTGFKLIQPEFMKMHYEFPRKNVMRGGFDKCFAYEGVKRFGMVENYQCGIVIRIQSWLDSLCVSCLLYTSDAADDLLCVDLGGRRNIKKKTINK